MVVKDIFESDVTIEIPCSATLRHARGPGPETKRKTTRYAGNVAPVQGFVYSGGVNKYVAYLRLGEESENHRHGCIKIEAFGIHLSETTMYTLTVADINKRTRFVSAKGSEIPISDRPVDESLSCAGHE